MTECLIILSNVVQVVDQLWAHDAMPAHAKCHGSGRVLEGRTRILSRVRPVPKNQHALPTPFDAHAVAAQTTTDRAAKALLASHTKRAWPP